MKNYIRFDPINFSQKKVFIAKEKELNSMQIEDFLVIIKDRKIAFRIFNYRNALGGFNNISQLSEVYEITDEIIKKLENIYLNFSKIRKISLNKASLEELKKQPYLRKFADQILKFRTELGLFKSVNQLRKIIKIEEKKFIQILPYLSL